MTNATSRGQHLAGVAADLLAARGNLDRRIASADLVQRQPAAVVDAVERILHASGKIEQLASLRAQRLLTEHGQLFVVAASKTRRGQVAQRLLAPLGFTGLHARRHAPDLYDRHFPRYAAAMPGDASIADLLAGSGIEGVLTPEDALERELLTAADRILERADAEICSRAASRCRASGRAAAAAETSWVEDNLYVGPVAGDDYWMAVWRAAGGSPATPALSAAQVAMFLSLTGEGLTVTCALEAVLRRALS